MRSFEGPRGCDFCKRFDSPTADIEEVCDHVESCLKKHWGLAVEQLPWESAEGGYFGSETWTTYEMLTEHLQIDLPRDHDDILFEALRYGLPDEVWCDYDWLTLDEDVALLASWEQLCETVKHKRRFFFHATGVDERDSFTPASLLKAIATSCADLDLLRSIPPGTLLWRARPDLHPRIRATPAAFGPPPVEHALQSNRMNPPGIPMLYLASTARTAVREARARQSRVGRWRTLRPLRILDLRRLPPVPGYFSSADRSSTLTLSFLHAFAEAIMVPVARDERVHIDYLPSQVVTEYMRDYPFDEGNLDGIAYPSTVNPSGWNVALFADPHHLGLPGSGHSVSRQPQTWLSFHGSIQAKA